MLAAGERMFAYPVFDGYWKDVGTIQSLWEANMDLLGDRPALDLRDESWRIFSRNYAEPPHFIGANAVVGNSLVTEGCEIYGSVINSVISGDVVVEKGAVVKDSVILDGVRICEGAQVHYSILDADTTVGGRFCRLRAEECLRPYPCRRRAGRARGRRHPRRRACGRCVDRFARPYARSGLSLCM